VVLSQPSASPRAVSYSLRAVKDFADVLAVLHESSRAWGVGEDFDVHLDDVLRRARALVGFDQGMLLVVDEAGGLVARRLLAGSAADPTRLRVPLAGGLSAWALAHGRAVRVADVASDPRHVGNLPDARSSLVVPLRAGGAVVAALSLESTRPDAFTEEHEQVLAALGAPLAVALDARRVHERLRQQIRQLDALHRISQLATEPRDVSQVLAAMLEVAEDVVPDGDCAILLLDHATSSLRVRASRGYGEAARAEIPLGRGVTGRAAASGQVIVVDDVSTETDYIAGVPGARSEVAVPLLADGRVIGVLNAESARPAVYRPEHLRSLAVIAQQAAVVLRAAQLHEETRRLAITDPLTALFNRRHFVIQLAEHLRRARRYQETLAVAFLDVDRFKKLNDTHGHNVGDRALQGVAGAMRQWVRDSDEVARLGGDEFAAILLQADGLAARGVIERIRGSVAGLGVKSETGEPVALTLSAGIALFPPDGSESEFLLARADAALYEAKRRGRNRVILAADVPPGTSGPGPSAA
jgi:diguanylate cyclase (GGDEF)-like protein